MHVIYIAGIQRLNHHEAGICPTFVNIHNKKYIALCTKNRSRSTVHISNVQDVDTVQNMLNIVHTSITGNSTYHKIHYE